MEESSRNLRKNIGGTIETKYPPLVIMPEELRKIELEGIEELRKKEIEEAKVRAQDVPGPNPKSFIPAEVKPKISRAQDTFEPRSFYVPEFKERKTRAQDVFEKKTFYIPEVKPRVSRAQDTFEPRSFYVPEVKPKKTRAQQV
jgi:hypothetical protein